MIMDSTYVEDADGFNFNLTDNPISGLELYSNGKCYYSSTYGILLMQDYIFRATADIPDGISKTTTSYGIASSSDIWYPADEYHQGVGSQEFSNEFTIYSIYDNSVGIYLEYSSSYNKTNKYYRKSGTRRFYINRAITNGELINFSAKMNVPFYG